MGSFSIIIPAPEWNGNWPALRALKENPPSSPCEIIVALGRHPAIQRNEALRQATGSIIIFLDSDSSIAPDYWQALERSLEDETVAILGGPSLLQKGHGGWEPIFQALLTNPFIVGPMANRYKPATANKSASQADLILCNMAARRSVFEKIGMFSPHLFPNEENEWMERATHAGLKILYQPLLQVSRPQRKTLRQFFYTMIRYGIGRTHQFKITRRFALPMLAPVFLLCGIVGFLLLSWFTGFALTVSAYAGCYLALAFLQGCTSFYLSFPRPTIFQMIVVGLLGPLVLAAYSLGQLLGWKMKGSGSETASVMLVNEQNKPFEKKVHLSGIILEK